MTIVQRLFPVLPDGYVAAPGVHLGAAFEIDVSAYEQDETIPASETNQASGSALKIAPPPTFTLETELPEQDEYEVRVYDSRRGRTLVAAIELVSPANKDRPESRRAFVAKCAALLQEDVACRSWTLSRAAVQLYADLWDDREGRPGGHSNHLTCTLSPSRAKRIRQRPLLDTWFYPLVLGQPLPPLPIWQTTDLHVSLDLEASYEDACRVLRIA